jgi:glyceraldehyde 3-phosphate dehydrogenase
MNIAINGFGRIGKSFLRALFCDKKIKDKINVVAINQGPSKQNSPDLFFKYDTIMGIFNGDVSYNSDCEVLKIDEKEIKLLSEKDPNNLPWKNLNIDWVVEASGCFTKKALAEQHILAGAKKVLITAPALDANVCIIPGVNDKSYLRDKHYIISLGSCTTNCFAPLVKVVKENFNLVSGVMTTIHAYTNTQHLLDSAGKDHRKMRCATMNIIPTTTGANKMITKIYPELEGKLSAIAVRVPVQNVSLVDFSFVHDRYSGVDEINKIFKESAQEALRNILMYTNLPLVSSDYIGNTHSAIFDATLTQSVENQVKVFAWYDNEYGYSCRLKDFLLNNVI